MRVSEIKFRGVSEESGKMRYGSLTVEYDGTCHIYWWESVLIEPENNYYEPVHQWEVVKPETVGQFTGLKDKNEVEIYSGDIVLGFGGDEKGQIVFSQEDAAFIFKSNTGGGAFINEMYLQNFKVIGNIHENSELCK